eukprot:gene28019-31121_t
MLLHFIAGRGHVWHIDVLFAFRITNAVAYCNLPELRWELVLVFLFAQALLTTSQEEVARLREENAEILRQNSEYGKRPAARADALTIAGVLALIAARQPRADPAIPMELDNRAARGSTSADDLYHGCGNGRAVGQKHTLPQGAREDGPAPTEPQSRM